MSLRVMVDVADEGVGIAGGGDRLTAESPFIEAAAALFLFVNPFGVGVEQVGELA
jgi:hypothetical protein